MKKMMIGFALLLAAVLMFNVSCNAQTNPYFRVSWDAYPGASKYIVLTETLPSGTTSHFAEDIDYKDPIDLTQIPGITVIETNTLSVSFRSPADGTRLHVAVVVVNVAGYYGDTAYAFLTKGTAPGKVGNLTITKE